MSNEQMEMMAREHDMTAVDAQFAEEVADTITEGTVNGYKKIENGVVTGYKKIEDSVVGAYKKVEDAFVNTFIAKEGETAQDAKARVAADTEAREAAQKAMIEKSLEASRNAGKQN